jgi:predicted unusual protein kinase regulating ubiquinone biosynthesis (AarF/ABC1/UbiB family)
LRQRDTIDPNAFSLRAMLSRSILASGSFRDLLEVGFFHADPHPGNVIISNGDTMNDDP